MAKLTLDLHDIYNRSDQIEAQLNRIVQEAIAKRIALVEIIPGKGRASSKNGCCAFSIKPIFGRSITALKKTIATLGGSLSTSAINLLKQTMALGAGSPA